MHLIYKTKKEKRILVEYLQAGLGDTAFTEASELVGRSPILSRSS